MNKYVLISCCKTKAKGKMPASELYISNLFKKSMAYAKSLKPTKIFILSAKHGLLELDDPISTYDETLNSKKSDERKKWANKVIQKLTIKTDLNKDEFIFLAGMKYRQYLLPHIKRHKIPMLGISLFEQPKWLQENTHG